MPSVTMEWESRLGRRLRVRDLYILTTVVNSGSMAKAARRLSMAQPSVSAAIANLEHMLGVRLLDRSPHGVEPTIYADALLKRSIAVFDELKQSVTDVESLADPTTGELRIGCPEMFIATLLVGIIEHFSAKYPQVTVHVQDVPPPAIRHPGLRERAYDLVIGGHHPQAPGDHSLDDLDMHYIVEDQMIIAAGPRSRWASRRKIDLAEIVNEPWMLPPPVSANYNRILDACRQRGLAVPTPRLVGFSMYIVNRFVGNGPFLAVYPRTVALYLGLKVLPVELPERPWRIAIGTLKNRTLSPVVERFIACAREVTKSPAGKDVIRRQAMRATPTTGRRRVAAG
jgi:DNA-binding transcriptional LysR family regulator